MARRFHVLHKRLQPTVTTVTMATKWEAGNINASCKWPCSRLWHPAVPGGWSATGKLAPLRGRGDNCREIALPPPICSAFHKRSSGSASLLRHERVIRPRLRSPSLSNGNSPLRRNRRSGSRHIPQSPFSGPKRLADGLFVISTFWELSFSAAISIPATKWMPT